MREIKGKHASAHIHACIHTFTHMCMHTHSCIHAHTHSHIHACTHSHIHMHAYIHSHTHACMHTLPHTCVHAFTHTCVCTQEFYSVVKMTDCLELVMPEFKSQLYLLLTLSFWIHQLTCDFFSSVIMKIEKIKIQ